MRTGLLALLTGCAAAMVFVGTAIASGPAPPGKLPIELHCQGMAPFTVVVPEPSTTHGTGQIVGMKGHATPTAFTLTATDVTQGFVVSTETTEIGDGHAHPNQATTDCSGVLFDGSASDFYGPDLPPGVHADDEILFTLDVPVILKT